MKKNSTNILSAAVVMLIASTGNMAWAVGSPVSDAWSSSNNAPSAGVEQVGNSMDEDALLQSLYNEEEDAELARMLASEDYIFPTSLTDNWHVDAQLGAMTTWGSYCKEYNFMNRTNFAAAVSIGKYLTPVSDLRLSLFYGRGTGVRGLDGSILSKDYGYEKLMEVHPEWELTDAAYAQNQKYNWHTLGLSIHWLPNFTHMFRGYDPFRKFTVSGIVGVGMEHTFSYNEKRLSYISVWAESPTTATARDLVALQFGFHLDYKLNENSHLTFEAYDNFLDDSFDGLISDQKWDIHLNTLVGLCYYLPSKNQRARNSSPYGEKYAPYLDKIKSTRDEIEDALASRKTEVEYSDVTKNVTYTLISFDENDIEVPRLQQNNVFQTAETYKATPASKIFITNSNKVDDNTFHQRAWSISKLLNQRWQIPLEDIWVAADESEIQKLQIPDVKTYIIFIINE